MVFDYALIDAQYLLYRNKSLLEGNHKEYININGVDHIKLLPIPKTELYKSILQSFMKLRREYADYKIPLYLFDKSPYYKVTAIEQYKSDRYKPTEDEINELEESKEGKTTDEIKVIEIEQNNVRIKMHNYATMNEIKYSFLTDEWKNFGFGGCIKSGYEADDLAYLLAKGIAARNKTAIMLTVDKDWVSFIQPNIYYMSTKTWRDYPDIQENLNDTANKINETSKSMYGNSYVSITPYEVNILNEIAGYGHNNAITWDHKDYDWFKYAACVVNNDPNDVPDFELARNAYLAMNMNIGRTTNGTLYIDDTKKYVDYLLDHNYQFNHEGFVSHCQANMININFSSHEKYLNQLASDVEC